MQHYIRIGWGFECKNLTEVQFDTLVESLDWNEFKFGKINISLEYYTEDCFEDKDRCACIVKFICELPNGGKAQPLNKLIARTSKLTLSSEEKSFILKSFNKLGIPQMSDKIELLIYSCEY